MPPNIIYFIMLYFIMLFIINIWYYWLVERRFNFTSLVFFFLLIILPFYSFFFTSHDLPFLSLTFLISTFLEERLGSIPLISFLFYSIGSLSFIFSFSFCYLFSFLVYHVTLPFNVGVPLCQRLLFTRFGYTWISASCLNYAIW